MSMKETSEVRHLGTAWYVLQTKINGHDSAVTHLTRQGFCTLMPLQEQTRRTRFGLRTLMRPLFNGYIFVSRKSGLVNWTAVRSTRGISRIVPGTGGKPATLPPQIAQELIESTNKDGSLKASAAYDEGDSVSVVNGPLSGWLAQVIAADDTDRIRLLVDVMGRKTPLNVARKDIVKVNVS